MKRLQKRQDRATKKDNVPYRSIEATLTNKAVCRDGWKEEPAHSHEGGTGPDYNESN